MELVSLGELEVGMILAQDIMTDSFVTIMSESTVLTDELIIKLNRLEVEFLYIKGEEKEESIENITFESLNFNFNKTIDAVKNIFNDIKMGESIIREELDNSTSPLLEGVLSIMIF